ESRRDALMLRRADAAMLAMVVVWGVNFPIVKITLREISPMVFNALRFGGATVLLLAVGARGGNQPVPRAAWPGIIALGLLGCAVLGRPPRPPAPRSPHHGPAPTPHPPPGRGHPGADPRGAA